MQFDGSKSFDRQGRILIPERLESPLAFWSCTRRLTAVYGLLSLRVGSYTHERRT